MDLENLRYPTGRFQWPATFSKTEIQGHIDAIEKLPQQLKKIASGLSPQQLNTPYRPDGWTLRQVIHHLADSHHNSYIRFKWTLTEEQPTIKGYNEKAWAELPEAKAADVEVSIALLTALHRRWVMMLRNLSEADLHRSFIHPESGKVYPLFVVVALYAWHGKHHLGHLGLVSGEGGS